MFPLSMKDLQIEESYDTTLPYGLLYGGFITCVEMYPIIAASENAWYFTLRILLIS